MALPHSVLYALIGRRVRARRDDLGLTQAELAAAAGVARSTVANLEAGRQQVPLGQLIQVARALDTDYRELLPPPEELIGPARGPVTATTVQENAPITAGLIQQLRDPDSIST